jgi:hypothetical protein
VHIRSAGDHYLRYTSEWAQGGLYLYSGNVGFIQPNLESSTNKYTVLAWDALVSGTVDITLDIPAADTVSLIVVKNGQIVYPVSTDDVTVSADDRSTWYVKTNTTAVDDLQVADELTVTAGDEIRFIMSRNETGDTTSCVWPTITYTNDLSKPVFTDEIVYGGTTSFHTNFPTYDKTNDVVTWNGGWQLVYYPGINDIAGGKPQLLEKGMNLDGANNALTILAYDDKGIGDVTVAAEVAANSGWGGPGNYALAVKSNVVAGYRYKADRAGSLTIDFT